MNLDRATHFIPIKFHSDDVTGAYVRLANLPSYPLDRLCRYEATLWRQADQIMFALRYLGQRKF